MIQLNPTLSDISQIELNHTGLTGPSLDRSVLTMALIRKEHQQWQLAAVQSHPEY